MAFKKDNLPWNKGKKGLQVPWNKGISMKEESRKKLSESHKGKIPWNKGKTGIYSKETKRKMGEGNKGKASWLGKRHTEESNEKNRQSHIGKIPWNKGKKGLQVPWIKGKKHSKESKIKMSKAIKKAWDNPEKREKMIESQKEVFSSNPELRKKRSVRSRQILLRLYESGDFPRQTNTKPERQIKEELMKRGYKEGIDFIHQYKFMNKFMCDFCFPKQKLIIEVDGDFWHANPNKYPTDSTLHPHQIKGMRKDKAKTAYITKVDDGSWTLIRFWESDIKKDVSKCVDRIEEVLAKKNN